jgi:hypothetical protein
MLRDLGATDIDVAVVQPVLRQPEDLQMLDRFAETAGVFATLPRMIQVSARAPGV